MPTEEADAIVMILVKMKQVLVTQLKIRTITIAAFRDHNFGRIQHKCVQNQQ